MTYENLGQGALDYLPCRYGKSKLLFRGPRRKLEGDYVLFLGGNETYGKFIAKPFPMLVEATTGRTCVNFGCVNAGVDVFMNDDMVFEAAENAALTVIQVMGAHNMSNRFYTVHPRRNDRFIQASALLQQIYREVDFTEFHFTRHMLATLYKLSPERFGVIQEELQAAWLGRMRLLLGRVRSKKALVWFADHTPDQMESCPSEAHDPLFVDQRMLDQIRPDVDCLSEISLSQAALSEGPLGMVFSEMEAPAASTMLSARAHQEAAAQLSDLVTEVTTRKQ